MPKLTFQPISGGKYRCNQTNEITTDPKKYRHNHQNDGRLYRTRNNVVRKKARTYSYSDEYLKANTFDPENPNKFVGERERKAQERSQRPPKKESYEKWFSRAMS